MPTAAPTTPVSPAIAPTTPVTDAPILQQPSFDVVTEVGKLQHVDAQRIIDLALTFGPGVAIGLASFAAMIAIKQFIISILSPKRGDTTATDIASGWRFWLLPFVRKISPLLLFIIAASIGMRFIPAPEMISRAVNTALGLTILIQLGLIATTVLKLRTQHMIDHSGSDNKYDSTQVTMFATLSMIGQTGIWVIVLLLCMENIGVNVTTLVAGVGIGGIAIAFAFKSILEDVFASLSIAFDKPFVIGDFIISGEYMGTIEKIGMKNIRIRSLSGEQIIINNNDILSNRIRNYGRMRERRVVFALGIEYGTSAEKLRAIPNMIRAAIEAQPHTRFDRSHFKDYGTSSLNFETVYFMTVPDYNVMMDVQQAINLTIYEKFEQQGIGFAFPTRTIHMHPADKAA